jgi:hypothetical protein
VIKVGIFRSSCFAGSMIPGVVLVFVANTRNGPVSHETELCMMCQESVLTYLLTPWSRVLPEKLTSARVSSIVF